MRRDQIDKIAGMLKSSPPPRIHQPATQLLLQACDSRGVRFDVSVPMKAALGTSLLWFIGTGRATPTETTGIAPLDWAIGKITVTAYRPSHTHTVHIWAAAPRATTAYRHRAPRRERAALWAEPSPRQPVRTTRGPRLARPTSGQFSGPPACESSARISSHQLL